MCREGVEGECARRGCCDKDMLIARPGKKDQIKEGRGRGQSLNFNAEDIRSKFSVFLP